MVPAVTELCYPHPAHSWTRRLAIYPRLRPPQRGQTKPFGQRCAVRCSPHRTSSPKRERNSLTVMMDFRFNGLDFFISDILSPFVRLFKLDIHQEINGLPGPPAAGVDLPLPRAFGGVARLHQEDTSHAGRRFGDSAQAPARVGLEEQGGKVMSKKHMGSSLDDLDRKSTRLNSSHVKISYAV